MLPLTFGAERRPHLIHVARRRAAMWPKEAAVLMRTNSYASILGAVANVLELADARSFAVRDGQHGLSLDLVDGRGERHAVDLSLADVAELVAWSEARSADATERLSSADARDEGVLRAFLEHHALVGAH